MRFREWSYNGSIMSQIPEQVDLVDGRRLTPTGRSGVALRHPDTGRLLADGLATDAATVDAALAAAHRAWQSRVWTDLPLEERAQRLEACAAALEPLTTSGALAEPESLNTGIPISVTGAMTGGLAGYFHGAAHFLRTRGDVEERPGRHGRVVLHRAPRGPAVVIAPWNAPSPIIVGRAAFAIAAGCPVIVKPSEWAPFTADLVMAALAQVDLPAGLVQMVHGGATVGAQLVADRRARVVAFTGGLAAGRAIAAAAAPNFAQLQLELGGNNPAIVRADADLAATAAALARGMTKLNGQWCEAPGKLIVHRSVAAELLERLLAELASLPIGPCLDPATVIGPMSHEARKTALEAHIVAQVAAGATAHRVHTVPSSGGWFVAPAVLTGLPSSAASTEVFGPVVTLHEYDSDDQALTMANEAGDGLAGFVFTADVDAAFVLGTRLRGGEIRINGTGLFDLCDASTQSFWGTSGMGGHGDVEVFEMFRGSRIIGVDDPAAPM